MLIQADFYGTIVLCGVLGSNPYIWSRLKKFVHDELEGEAEVVKPHSSMEYCGPRAAISALEKSLFMFRRSRNHIAAFIHGLFEKGKHKEDDGFGCAVRGPRAPNQMMKSSHQIQRTINCYVVVKETNVLKAEYVVCQESLPVLEKKSSRLKGTIRTSLCQQEKKNRRMVSSVSNLQTAKAERNRFKSETGEYPSMLDFDIALEMTLRRPLKMADSWFWWATTCLGLGDAYTGESAQAWFSAARLYDERLSFNSSAPPGTTSSGMNTNENDSIAVSSLGLERSSLRIPDQKIHYINALLRSLDALIFLQLGISYLCDNLTFLLLLRAVSQVLHVQYRPPSSIQLPPVIFANFLCFGTHLLQHKSSTKRLHGGLIVDFVGELGTTKWRLVFLDVVICGLQLLMLVVGNEKQILLGDIISQEESQPPDLEAGRARSRARERPRETEEGIELQSLLPDRQGGDQPTRPGSVDTDEDNDMIVLDMKTGLKSLLRKPMVATSTTTVENPTTRAELAHVLARLATTRTRNAGMN
ncbi:uncharacterized protein Z518_08832 [Rhinocladiella mackenziei CBS 650.93]|uniref:Rhinocladiella mackenziei CBS 650.93 unplaced genomic scaffold supercont1.6, whole genome shotgun sequence n=1 Tax=Rhinocladiella mackenziei CBS 650.93 TaxID=1442369 RepID=A0A0D2IAM0_9EURO|nr:uncharacterized protein Z518_08832 [Rhinocladiella mackenziei CBS 650.93]KIX02889.1 hypothetical protein Z518_08832 [Rhinocladiella mackenziei CBS 650.93]